MPRPVAHAPASADSGTARRHRQVSQFVQDASGVADYDGVIVDAADVPDRERSLMGLSELWFFRRAQTDVVRDSTEIERAFHAFGLPVLVIFVAMSVFLHSPSIPLRKEGTEEQQQRRREKWNRTTIETASTGLGVFR